MATNYAPQIPSAPTGSSVSPESHDLPPPYSAVVGNPQYGFVSPAGDTFIAGQSAYQQPRSFTAPGVYPHPTIMTNVQSQAGDMAPPSPSGVPVGVVVPVGVGSKPTTVTCYSCGKIVTTKVKYTTAWHTHLVAGSICVITMVCSLCCLGLIPYCFDSFKDVEHYCPNCNTFIGKNSKC